MKTQLAIGVALLTWLLPAGVNAQAKKTMAVKPGEVTVIGCLMREADYRAMMKDKPEGLLPAIAQGGDYVLVNAKAAEPARTGQRAVGTSGTVARDYSLTGKLEDHMVNDIGRMVEVVGTVQNGKSARDMSKIAITVWHPVGDYCPVK